GNDTSFCESGLRTFLLFAQQNCISKGKGAAANAETKPPGLREKALSEVRSYDLRVNVDLKKGKQKSSPDLGEDLGGVKRYTLNLKNSKTRPHKFPRLALGMTR